MPEKKNYTEWTRKEFEALPDREKWSEPVYCRTLVILPTRRKHDSGFRMIDAIAIGKNGPICRVSGISDVIHLDGIGGFGEWNPNDGVPNVVAPKAWSIDCLPVSRLLQIWPSRNEYQIKVDMALSSLEVFAVKKEHSHE